MFAAIGWIVGWLSVSISTAVVWEFAVHPALHLAEVGVRIIITVAALMLSIPVIIFLELAGSTAQRIWDDFRPTWSEIAEPAVRFGSVPLISAGLYIWFASWLLTQLSVFLGSRIKPAWLPPSLSLREAAGGMEWTWGVCVAVACVYAILFAAIVYQYFVRRPFYSYSHAADTLGWRKAVLGVCLMSYLRLLTPRRDFFRFAPVLGWMPVLMIAVLIYEFIPVRALGAIGSALAIIFTVPVFAGFIAPPAWLFLGTSDFESQRTFYVLRGNWCRHGLNLLDRTGPGGADFYAAWRSTQKTQLFYDPGTARVWSLRTRPRLWMTAVRLLAAFVPVIVIDRRRSSDYLAWELDWLDKQGFSSKVYIIVDDEADAVEAMAPSDVVKVNEKTLMRSSWRHNAVVLRENENLT